VGVKINDSGFSPNSITIPAGSTVIWENAGNRPHTVTRTSGPAKFDSGNMAPGATFQFTFTRSGTYEYDCLYHPFMTATIVVR
jgi:plastocyanin